MFNVFTALQPTLFSAAREVSNEPAGLLGAIAASFDDQGVARGDVVNVPVAPTRPVSDFTPANVAATGDSAAAAAVVVRITASRKVGWHITGEQQRSLENAGSDKDWVRQMVAQGMRAIRNNAESDLANELAVGASRAFGEPGVTPFGSDLSELTSIRKILQDNGAPMADLQFVGDTAVGMSLRNLGVIQQADRAGSDEERRTGRLLRQFGFQIGESAGIATKLAGTGAGYQSNNAAGFPVGATNITVDTGTGTVLAGDIVSFAGDGNLYVVAAPLAGGLLRLNAPGLRRPLADNVAMTRSPSFVPSYAFERSAVVGVMRPPVMPANPTQTTTLISDRFGLTYLLMEIAQYGQVTWELHLAWGFKVVQPEHVAVVLG